MRAEPIAITGCGAVTAFGDGVDALWRGLVEARSAVGRVTRFDASPLYTQLAAEVPGPLPTGTPEEERAVVYMRRAVGEALADAGVAGPGRSSGTPLGTVPPERISVAIGTTLGGMAWGETYFREGGPDGPRAAEILGRLHYHVLAEAAAEECAAGGEVTTVSAACASSLNAIAHGVLRLRAGRDDVVIAGGADALSAFVYSGFCSLLALAPEAPRPFDRRRKGLALGEGAGVVVLERLADARKRGARVRAVVAGCGTAGDAHHLTGPHKEGEGLLLAARRALAQAGAEPQGVGYVNAHGTATPFNDKMEYVALSRLGGAEWARRVPVSSTKAATGHCLGAAGAVETIACVRALETGLIPPTLNFEVPDPDCPVDCVPNEARGVRGLRAALNLAAGFGGQNAALVIERADP